MLEVTYRKISELTKYERNSRTHSDAQVSQIMGSIKEFGFTNPILIDTDGGIIAGHGRLLAAQRLGMATVPTITLDGLSETQRRAYVIADNKLALNAGWDEEMLKLELQELDELGFDIDLTGFSAEEIGALDVEVEELQEEKYADGVSGSMSKIYNQPPFSVLDTRKVDWIERKRYWREKIGDNGESRENALSDDGGLLSGLNNGVSLLDPCLAEIIVSWFGCKNGTVIDPFAGDSVFGYVAGSKGMEFKGIELRHEQAELNRKRTMSANLPCVYYCDTSENIDKYIDDNYADLIFSCPPYADLEVYSDDKRDLSNMTHNDFFIVYKKILQSTYAKLKENRFAIIVISEVRDKKGVYLGIVPKTIQIMEEAGYKFYNEIILINNAGTLPLRAGKSMQASRKVGRMHQNVLVFLKGDAKKAATYLGEIKESGWDCNE